MAQGEDVMGTASSECPCIDPWGASACSSTYYGGKTCEETGTSCRLAGPPDSECKARNYGASRCAAWDCIPTVDLFCERQWCYVDRNNCNRTTTPSVFFPTGVDLQGDAL
eukprot:CAMPEP_0198226678 /NCGR_PEP_ID=MMETSP1445-20131203/106155_1 /TAXON_ID=36898 /ORGANISM="Pyramimonas sp., Strain CCMP2087" /LENGTH=109 /DNA_ID=CAMNT_0043906537 /DNA_START=311 /DNA_END=637 /DNA_ORIENTATION=+